MTAGSRLFLCAVLTGLLQAPWLHGPAAFLVAVAAVWSGAEFVVAVVDVVADRPWRDAEPKVDP